MANRIIPFILLCWISTTLVAQEDTVVIRKRLDSLGLRIKAGNYPALLMFNELRRRYFKEDAALRAQYLEYDQLITDRYRYMKYVISDTSIYGEMQRIWISQQGISYGTLPFVGNYQLPIGARRIDLQDGEGKDGILMEANFDYRFFINMGRPSARAWQRRTRITFDYRGNFRMMKDESKPIVPWSNDVGIGWDFAFYDSHRKWFWTDHSRYDQTTLQKTKKETFFFTTLTTQVHHYSNGQPPGFYYYVSDSSQKRNDYKHGDFSTNYVRTKLIGSWATLKTHRIINAGIGWRFDWGEDDGALNYTPEQRGAYGCSRLEYLFDWYSGIVGDEAKYRKLRQWHVRFEGDLILDNLDNFVPNLTDTIGKHRFTGHVYVELRPLSHRSIGYMFHFYGGRDYLNIRYDDIVVMAQFGLTLSLDKYYPTGWRVEHTGGSKK